MSFWGGVKWGWEAVGGECVYMYYYAHHLPASLSQSLKYSEAIMNVI